MILFTEINQKDLLGAFKSFSQTVTNVLLLLAENIKNSYSWHFNNHSSQNKHDN